jgi:hypothetical protein
MWDNKYKRDKLEVNFILMCAILVCSNRNSECLCKKLKTIQVTYLLEHLEIGTSKDSQSS